ncbi:DUF1097 domain-containing protein [Adhaeribacter pallidiroseus]|uniref:DUF1097 domain-containing protein n=1 Tax=Adhaeribacter pallidiroseus TaxID=2072847 RepID=A0A369QJI0_9BACT|nr:DUF1097 domain-containing protein [Adhaeribacter pallidiroseus]RDC62428.1 hypothetical protein AHMF7616_01022 [Adhaeribacter pallidiroseus]
MKTFLFGAIMGLFGALAVYLSISLEWPGWVLFMAWICFYLYGKSVQKSLNIYLQIILGIGLSVLIELAGEFLAGFVGEFGPYLAIFILIGSLAFLIKIKNLHDLTAWFFGLVVFYGAEPTIALIPIIKQLFLPLAAGFTLGYGVDFIVTKLVHSGSTSQAGSH